jgi:CRISPR-associated protein Csm3
MHIIHLFGRVIIKGKIRAVTGMHIGGSPVALEIGALDLPVVRNPANGQPYIPGSSLKGKMRSLSEKLTGAPQNYPIGKGVTIHIAGGRKRDYANDKEYVKVGAEQYKTFWVNPVFGVPGEVEFPITGPTRLVVRDVPLDPKSLEAAKDNLDMPFTEIKWENALDRVTSAATPRQIERVPAGAVFTPLELVFNVHQADDVDLFGHVLTALQLVQDDYLGGHGSRGSGKVAFESLTLVCKTAPQYVEGKPRSLGDLIDLSDAAKKEVVDWVQGQFAPAFENGAK